MNSASQDTPLGPRQALRKSLAAQREKFVATVGFEEACAALSQHLAGVLLELEPELLGLYWPQRCEFNAAMALAGDTYFAKLAFSLPFAQRNPPRMQYRAWDRSPPTATDECGIPTSAGAPVVPDVVLVPCLGFTPEGYRLGYGGGYFDRWLAMHPDVTAIGVAWGVGRMAEGAYLPEGHDIPLAVIVTETGVVA